MEAKKSKGKGSAPSRKVRMPKTAAGSTSSKMDSACASNSSDNSLMPKGKAPKQRKMGKKGAY